MTQRFRKNSLCFIPFIVCFITIATLSFFILQEYRQTSFESFSKFCQILIENNPEAEQLVLTSLKEYTAYSEAESNGNLFLTQYGYGHGEFGKDIKWRFLALSTGAFLVIGIVFLSSLCYLRKGTRIRVDELTAYLEQVNMGGSGTIIQLKEDVFSHLQDEMYKTVTALYQSRESAIKAKSNFSDNLANVAHQLKTPLTASFLSLQLMKEAAPNPYVPQIKKQLERLNQLEEALLTLSKIDAGTLLLENSAVDIYTALSLAAENLSELLEKENITVMIPDKGCIEIQGDLEWTMEALINLIKNCMEHSPKNGTIHCDYWVNPLYAEILIWDEGSGLDIADIPYIFQRFYRGKNAGSEGAGIGLSLSRAIFELQNGTIAARNLPEGGACFEIRVYSH